MKTTVNFTLFIIFSQAWHTLPLLVLKELFEFNEVPTRIFIMITDTNQQTWFQIPAFKSAHQMVRFFYSPGKSQNPAGPVAISKSIAEKL